MCLWEERAGRAPGEHPPCVLVFVSGILIKAGRRAKWGAPTPHNVGACNHARGWNLYARIIAGQTGGAIIGALEPLAIAYMSLNTTTHTPSNQATWQ